MAIIDMKRIRNIALLGHSGSGKTSLAEAMLYVSGGSDRLGKTAEGNSNFDYDPESVKRKISISAGFAPVMWKDVKINVIDTPGHPGFAGDVSQALRVADSAVIVIDAKSGIEVGTELAWDRATAAGLPKAIFINKFDDNQARFAKILDALHEKFGRKICPITIPMIKDGEVCGALDLVDTEAHAFDDKGQHHVLPIPEESKESFDHFHEMLLEAIAGTDEELMDKYFSGEDISHMEICNAIHEGIIHGDIVPCFCGCATKLWGAWTLMDAIAESFPRHSAKGNEISADLEEIAIQPDGAPALFIFKTVADPFVGKLSYFKVVSGKVSTDTPLVNMRTGNQERITKVLTVRGKKQEDAAAILAGDIGAIPKLTAANTGDTLCSPTRKVILDGIDYPAPSFTMAVYPKKKGEEDKVAQGLARLVEEDPTIQYKNDPETKELVMSGMGEQHLDVVVSKLKSKFNVEVELKQPKVAYRETIRGKSDVEGKHKKQSGGSGQYGDVWIKFEPCDSDGLEFDIAVVGGSVPKQFFPAVEKGLRDSIKHGPLAGYPVVGVKATLYDGKYHPVDSNEMAFKTAAQLAFKAGIPQAKPALLEPVGSLKATVPDANMGDIMGEVNKRRGRVLGMNAGEDGMQIVEAEVPMAEMADFSVFMRQCTQGRGSYSFEFERYEDAPAQVAQKVIEAAKADID